MSQPPGALTLELTRPARTASEPIGEIKYESHAIAGSGSMSCYAAAGVKTLRAIMFSQLRMAFPQKRNIPPDKDNLLPFHL